MSPSMTPETNPIQRTRRFARAGSAWPVRLILTVLLACAVLAVVGCGGGNKAEDKNDVLLATVGDKEIKGSYYEERLALLKQEELPRENGQLLDMASLEGKEKFLETLINKEVMAKTAMALGYGNDPQIVGARNSLIAFEAGTAMWANEIVEPANTITEEQLQEFYAKLGSRRVCRYVITNFIDDARAAREMALGGADWQDVVAKYHVGEPTPDGKYEISVPYGRYTPNFENAVFNAEIGSITEPVETIYGFWVLKIDEEKPGKRPPLEEAKAQILDVKRSRTVSQLRDAFKAKVREKYKFVINEDALWRVYNGMPVKEDLFYPGTKDPVKKEDLQPLDVTTADMELPFYSYVTPDGTERLYTVGDYKAIFDKMSVFQRPKHAQMLGGLRSKITEELEKTLVNFEAEALGYYEHPDVLFKVDTKVEELLVNKLYTETVVYEKRITPEELDNFWAEHKTEYQVPVTRSGRLVICADRASADAAFAAAGEGVAWRDILVEYGTDKDNKARSGKIEGVREDGGTPVAAAMFTLEVGGVSAPVALGDGRYAVAMLEGIHEPYQRELKDIAEEVGQRMKLIREDEAFQNMLTKWRADLNIVTYPENLAGLKSWQELVAPPLPDNLVPRN